MRWAEWKALDWESDPGTVPSERWLRKPLHVRAKMALPPPQAPALLGLPSYRRLRLAPAEEGSGLRFQVQRRH